ncbi:MAG: DUF883 C-terminal domain-containing protein [Proteobacteria bacterium]|nr:DUF883 C-terminal domain-containing protein [Pseudomonadota bacterium]
MREASERIEQIITPILERPDVKEQVERVRTQLEELDTRARRVVQERPLVAVGAALVFGYALGRLLARR